MGAFTQALLPLGTRTVSETPVLCHFKLGRLAAHRSDLPGLPPRQRLEDTKLGRGACASSPQGCPAQEEPSPRAFCIHPLGPHDAAVFTQPREGIPGVAMGPARTECGQVSTSCSTRLGLAAQAANSKGTCGCLDSQSVTFPGLGLGCSVL